jgi:hypothetical protein
MHLLKSLPDFFIITIFVIWAILSVLSQSTTKIKNKLKKNDLLNILPNYKFFCPNPIRHDYFLYYRKVMQDSSWSDWEKMSVGKKTPMLCLLWNPLKKERKVFYRMAKDLKRKKTQYQKRKDPEIYKHLHDFVKLNADAKSYQFKIVSCEFRNDIIEQKELYTSES